MNIIPSLIEQSLLYVPLVIGAHLDIGLMKVPDLALSSAFTFGAITATKALSVCSHLPQPIALCITIFAALIGGMLVGFISSTLTQKAGFSHLLSSIITEGLFHGINQMVLGSSNCSLSFYKNPLSLPFFGNYSEIPLLLLISSLIIAAVIVLLKTPLGYAFSIYGNNQRFFNHHRISLGFVFGSGVIISNGLAGISGYFFAQSNGFVDTTMGIGIPLFAITILLLGKTVRKIHAIFAATAGLGLYFLLQQLLLRVGFNLNYFTLVQSFLILIILLVYQQSNKDNSVYDLGV